MDKLNSEDIVNAIFKKLCEPKRYPKDTLIDLRRVTEDKNLLNKMFLKAGHVLTESIPDFLNSHNSQEMLFYKEIHGKIHRIGSLNPHDKPDPYEKYFVEKQKDGRFINHLGQLYNLLEKDSDTGNLNLVEQQNILHIGAKGSGKTLSQNVWLYRRNEAFEQNNIIWIRLDARKLMDIWVPTSLNNKLLITPENYILGQLVYVFSKHFQPKYDNYFSPLFGAIASKLEMAQENKLSYYAMNDNVELTKANSESYFLDIQRLVRTASRKKIDTLIEFLVRYEKIIAQYEGIYLGEEKRRKNKEKTITSKSYLIDKVLFESQIQKEQHSTNFAEWMSIGVMLRDFILNNDYRILYLIDGLDNINYSHRARKEFLKKILHLLYDFPLKYSGSQGCKNELLLISLRQNTFDALQKIHNNEHHRDVNQYKKVEDFYKIYQDTDGLFKSIIDTRIDFILSGKKDDQLCFMAQVLKAMQIDPSIPEGEKWHSNIRCFLFNRINLAKFITYKYYFAGKPDVFDINKQIKIYENINILLNGYLFMWEEKHPSNSNIGHESFNLFGYVNANKMPIYFIYTYILLLIKSKEPITTKRICDILTCFKTIPITAADCHECIDKLVSSGMIVQEYSMIEDEIKYQITAKGLFILKTVYNDIHFLYYLSLDTKLPVKLIERFFIVANNRSSENEERNYPPYCIITGIYFLRYLLRQNNTIITKVTLKKELKKHGVDIQIFNLPVEKEELSKSIKEMVDIMLRERDKGYLQILKKWLNKSNS